MDHISKESEPYRLMVGPSVFDPPPLIDRFDQFMSRVSDPRMHRFYEYWRSKWSGERLPPRSAIDPTEILRFLPYLVLAEPEYGNGLRFRYRLMGSYLAGFAGMDYTGKYLDEVPLLDIAEPVERCSILTATEGRVTVLEAALQPYDDGSRRYVNKEKLPFTALVLPLSPDGKTVNMLFCLVCLPPALEQAWMAERKFFAGRPCLSGDLL